MTYRLDDIERRIKHLENRSAYMTDRLDHLFIALAGVLLLMIAVMVGALVAKL